MPAKGTRPPNAGKGRKSIEPAQQSGPAAKVVSSPLNAENNPLRITAEAGDSVETAFAKTSLRPSVKAAATIRAYDRTFGCQDVTANFNSMTAAALGGKWKIATILSNQAHGPGDIRIYTLI